jgi:UDP-GlcNAc:undecaprenyl-phosphate/decaprenyl-phosphate GlcNAc-1-phosphate transferase
MGAPLASLTFLAGALVSFAACALVRRIALDIGAVVAPRPDRWHRTPTPTFGGIAIIAGVFTGAAVAGSIAAVALPLLAATVALFVIGWYDDAAPLSALAKMVNSLAVAAFFVLTLATFRSTSAQAALTIVAIVWFAGLNNAINLLDNMDGLAAGVTAIAALGLAVTFSAELGPVLVFIPVALAGALLGFLGWNRHPARLFMGNCGSLAIGGLIAATATTAVVRAGTMTAAAAAALILIVPMVDTTFVVLLRRLAGRSTTRGNVDHLSHRLVSAGFSEAGAVGVLYAIGIVGAGAGYFIHAHGGSAWPLVAGVSVGVLMMALYLARLPAYAGQDFQALRSAPFAPLLADLTFRWHAGEVLLDLVLIATCYYAAYRIRFEGEALTTFLPGFSMSLSAILGCQLAALYVSGLYTRMWNTFGLHDLWTVLRGVASGLVLSVLAVTYLYKFERFSRGVFLIDAVLLTAAIVATRSSFRIIGRIAARSSPQKTRVAIYGAGLRGQLLAREMLANPAWDRNPVAFIEDDARKRAQRLLGVPVRGSIDDLDRVITRMRIEEVLLSSPAIRAPVEARIREICARHGVPVRRLQLEIV